MTRAGYAEASVVGRGLRGFWATTTSAVGEAEIQEGSATSDVVAYSNREMVLAVIPYARFAYTFPHHYGIAVLCEAPPEQVGLFEDAVVTSSYGPYSRVREAWNACWRPHAIGYPRYVPLPASAEDLLDWDLSIQAPPPRLSGTISVSLRYAGPSIPTPVPDLADE